MTDPHIKNILKNKKAYFEYEIDETFEAGLKLVGTEVKSLRNGHASFEGSYGKFKGNEIFFYEFTIQPYSLAGHFNHKPTRPRKLLLHRHEIRKIETKLKLRGYTLVPIELYFKNEYAKLKIGLGRGKKLYDKRQDIKKKETLRSLQKMRKF
ncbi:MAG: SsrA-binding protein SmpB [Planctomycetota bacterium]